MSVETEQQSKIEQNINKWISLENLQEALGEFPSPLRDRVMEEIQDNIKTDLVEENQIDADVYLEEVSRRVFGFRLEDLDAGERREIEYIKNSLEMSMESESTS